MIYYSHVNEDSSVERKQMKGHSIEHLYCIAGSGERVLALLDHPDLRKAHVIDNNPEALYLTELKIAALRSLPVEEYLSFTGYAPVIGRRRARLPAIAPILSPACRSYWMARKQQIDEGILYTGHFERFLENIRPLLRLFLGHRFYQCFQEKRESWERFPTLRWRLIKYLFSNQLVYRIAGMRDPAFVSRDGRPQVIPAALQKTLNEDRIAESCLFHLTFLGHVRQMPPEWLPPSFQPAILSKIRAKITQKDFRVFYHQGDVLQVLKAMKPEKEGNRFFSFSDLLSFVTWDYMENLIDHVAEVNETHSISLFRAFVRNRLREAHFDDLRKTGGQVSDLSAQEKTGMYQVVRVDHEYMKNKKP